MDKNEFKQDVKDFILERLDMPSRIKRLTKEFNAGGKHPFYISLFDEKSALEAKITHSVYTWIGQSFYEPFCKLLGEKVGFEVETQKKVLGECNKDVEKFLYEIENGMDYKPNRENEIKKLKSLVTPGKPLEHPDSTVDVYIKTNKGKEILIDITTVGNNKKSFRTLKKKILRWTAMRVSQDKHVDIEAYMAVPYNPYGTRIDSTEYTLWSQYYDRKDILVGDELWKTVSNNKIGIIEINEVFKQIGNEINL